MSDQGKIRGHIKHNDRKLEEVRRAEIGMLKILIERYTDKAREILNEQRGPKVRN